MAGYSLYCMCYGKTLLTHSVTQIHVTKAYFLWSQVTQITYIYYLCLKEYRMQQGR